MSKVRIEKTEVIIMGVRLFPEYITQEGDTAFSWPAVTRDWERIIKAAGGVMHREAPSLVHTSPSDFIAALFHGKTSSRIENARNAHVTARNIVRSISTQETEARPQSCFVHVSLLGLELQVIDMTGSVEKNHLADPSKAIDLQSLAIVLYVAASAGDTSKNEILLSEQTYALLMLELPEPSEFFQLSKYYSHAPPVYQSASLATKLSEYSNWVAIRVE